MKQRVPYTALEGLRAILPCSSSASLLRPLLGAAFVLSLPFWVPAALPLVSPSYSFREGSSVEARAAEIMAAWTEAYHLQDVYPPKQVRLSRASKSTARDIPWAPHLEECSALASQRHTAEEHQEGKFPLWTCARERTVKIYLRSNSTKLGKKKAKYKTEISKCSKPAVPWVRGLDGENLPKTRQAQRDIWVNQFPIECTHPRHRFLVTTWYPLNGYGIGSGLHLMSTALGLALASKRILVPYNYLRANHPACQEQGKNGTLDCYFFPMTSPECMATALTLKQELDLPALQQIGALTADDRETINSDARVVHLGYHNIGKEAPAADIWLNESSLDSPFEIDGSLVHNYSLAKVNWWHSQAIRFMLRWPSAYLCHLTNQARHEAYGHMVAREVGAAEAGQRALSHLKTAESRSLQPQDNQDSAPAYAGKPSRGSKGESEREGVSGGQSEEGGEGEEEEKRRKRLGVESLAEWRFQGEPYMPRPIVSVHVRQGDKVQEMEIFDFDAYMALAYRAKRLLPGMDNIWLSTEQQSVIDALPRYKDWRFHYTQGARQVEPAWYTKWLKGAQYTKMHDYEAALGFETHVGKSFANLLIAAQCDMFVGVLASNWNRLINELRLTNGRQRAQYITLNNFEF